MTIEKLNLIYFSPTGTTEKIIKHMQEQLPTTFTIDFNLTHAVPGIEPVEDNPESLTIIGAPVYAGRVATEALLRISHFKSKGTRAVIFVTYGNRHFDDALIELYDFVTEAGFDVVGAAAFIGEHSFSDREHPIAQGRPDSCDSTKADEFIFLLKSKIAAKEKIHSLSADSIPGNRPYKEAAARKNSAPETDNELCTDCKECVALCPVDAISKENPKLTAPGLCIRCCACIKGCPSNARSFDTPEMKQVKTMLYETCSEKKEPLLIV